MINNKTNGELLHKYDPDLTDIVQTHSPLHVGASDDDRILQVHSEWTDAVQTIVGCLYLELVDKLVICKQLCQHEREGNLVFFL